MNVVVNRYVRRIAIGVTGAAIILVGIALLVLPGPGVLTIAAGLGVLGTEFEFARRYMQWCRARGSSLSRCLNREELPPRPRS